MLYISLPTNLLLAGRQSHDKRWRHANSGDRKWPGSDVIWPELTCKWL